MSISNYTNKCMEFLSFFRGMRGVSTFQSESTDFSDVSFSGTVYIDHYEFVCVDQLAKNEYMVYINHPYEDDERQWVFGYYKTFKRALNKAKSIVQKRKYPRPVEIW